MISMSLADAAKAVRAQHQCAAGVRFEGCSIDSRQMPTGGLFIAMRGSHCDGHDFVAAARAAGAAAAMVEKDVGDVGLPCLLVDDTKQAMGRLAAYWRSGFDLPLLAVTGSNGKTTVRAMLEAICARGMKLLATSGNLNNELGVPLTLFRLRSEHSCAVVEMGAAAVGDIAYLASLARPSAAVITQCAPAHLQGFGSIKAVARTKGEVFTALPDDGTAVINIDDKWAPMWESLAHHSHRLRFGMGKPAEIRALNVRGSRQGSAFTLVTPRGRAELALALPGRHNVMNALAAAAGAHVLGLRPEDIAIGLKGMQAVPGRLQLKPGINESLILDDSYNANPVSLHAGLQVLRQYQRPRWLVLGEMSELGDDAELWHDRAGSDARDSGVSRLLAVGGLAALAARSFGAGASTFPDRDTLLANMPPLDEAPVILVKGSHCAGMDQIVKALQRRH